MLTGQTKCAGCVQCCPRCLIDVESEETGGHGHSRRCPLLLERCWPGTTRQKRRLRLRGCPRCLIYVETEETSLRGHSRGFPSFLAMSTLYIPGGFVLRPDRQGEMRRLRLQCCPRCLTDVETEGTGGADTPGASPLLERCWDRSDRANYANCVFGALGRNIWCQKWNFRLIGFRLGTLDSFCVTIQIYMMKCNIIVFQTA